MITQRPWRRKGSGDSGDSKEATARPGWEARRTERGLGPERQGRGGWRQKPRLGSGREVPLLAPTQPPSWPRHQVVVPTSLLFSYSRLNTQGKRSASGGSSARQGGPRRGPGPGSLQTADSPPCMAPGRSGQRPWPGHRPALGEPAAPPAGPAWRRRGRGGGSLALRSAPCSPPGLTCISEKKSSVAGR